MKRWGLISIALVATASLWYRFAQSATLRFLVLLVGALFIALVFLYRRYPPGTLRTPRSLGGSADATGVYHAPDSHGNDSSHDGGDSGGSGDGGGDSGGH
jgi:uncharacterized membrane protein YgcG